MAGGGGGEEALQGVEALLVLGGQELLVLEFALQDGGESRGHVRGRRERWTTERMLSAVLGPQR